MKIPSPPTDIFGNELNVGDRYVSVRHGGTLGVSEIVKIDYKRFVAIGSCLDVKTGNATCDFEDSYEYISTHSAKIVKKK